MGAPRKKVNQVKKNKSVINIEVTDPLVESMLKSALNIVNAGRRANGHGSMNMSQLALDTLVYGANVIINAYVEQAKNPPETEKGETSETKTSEGPVAADQTVDVTEPVING